ncbi:MAG TPA: signal peptidase I [Candidatus Saccharimonadales bacterium]|nr:signal peptidase I [Candidatus Saccharimonadales bacterium]
MMPQDVSPRDNHAASPAEPVNAMVPSVSDPLADNPDSNVKVVDSKDPQKESWRSIVSTIVILVAAPLVALLLINFVFQSYEVDGPSMESTLQDHDRLIVDKLPKTMARIEGRDYIPNRGNIIIFVKKGLTDTYNLGDKQLIKRVIGVPGDRVVVAGGHITIYNKDYPNGFNPDVGSKWASVIHTTSSANDIDVTVQSNEVFVCGDNRDNSLDSRAFGTVPASGIIGKLSFRIYPLSKAESF